MTTEQKLDKILTSVLQNTRSISTLYIHLSELKGLDPEMAEEFKTAADEALDRANTLREELS
jgi:hypothetical protein